MLITIIGITNYLLFFSFAPIFCVVLEAKPNQSFDRLVAYIDRINKEEWKVFDIMKRMNPATVLSTN